MKVLWLSSIPVSIPLNGTSENIGSSWILSLEKQIQQLNDIELGVTCKNNLQRPVKPFSVQGTRYFPITSYTNRNRLSQLIGRWKHQVESEESIDEYLSVIETFKPDLIHLFGTEFNYGLIISRTHVPCVIHMQGSLILVVHKWYSGIRNSDALRYANKFKLLKGFGFFHEYYSVRKAARREKKILSSCKYFMGRTNWDRRIASIFSPSSAYFHCDELIREVFYAHEWEMPHDNEGIVIVSVVRNVIYKGFETIHDCLAILKESIPEKKIIWKVAGINAEDEVSVLVNKSRRCHSSNLDIQLLGPLGEKELVDLLMGAHIFVHPSHVDNSPNSVCEAMLLGMPVITTYAGGIPDIIENNREGLLIQDGDPFAMAGAVIELINKPSFASWLGSKARTRAMERHKPEKIVSDLSGIYKTILKDSEK